MFCRLGSEAGAFADKNHLVGDFGVGVHEDHLLGDLDGGVHDSECGPSVDKGALHVYLVTNCQHLPSLFFSKCQLLPCPLSSVDTHLVDVQLTFLMVVM